MSSTRSADTLPIKLMRWVARILSIPWALWTLFWTLFILAQPTSDGEPLPTPVIILLMSLAALVFLGPAVVAGIWRKGEALGGGVLLAVGVLLAYLGVYGPHAPLMTGEFWSTVLGFVTIVLPPMVAGVMFLACHQHSKRQAPTPAANQRA